jgi:hypothetical protein
MPYAKLTITIPDSVWISEVSRGHADTRFRVLAATANKTSGVARLEIIGGDPPAVCREIRAYDSVTDLTILESDPGRSCVQIETTMPLLLTALQEAGVPLKMPLEVREGQLSLELTIPQETLSTLGNIFDEVGIQYTVERIQQEVSSDSLLTERQQWAIDEAIDRGYYDTPRRITLVELAEELDVAKSTCSEILHRAEERVLKEYVSDDRPAPSGTPMPSD